MSGGLERHTGGHERKGVLVLEITFGLLQTLADAKVQSKEAEDGAMQFV